MITWDNYPRYLMTTDELLQKKEFMKEEKNFN